MKLKEIQNLIKFVAKSGASEVSLETEDVKITIKTSEGSSPIVVHEPVVIPQQQAIPTVAAPVVSPVNPVVESPEEDTNLITVKS